MTVKNFLKTAVLGIAFCSVSCIASQGENDYNPSDLYYGYDLNGIIGELRACHDATATQGYDRDVRTIILSIVEIMNRAMAGNVTARDITKVNDNIDLLIYITRDYVSYYQHDVDLLVLNRTNIINQIREILKIKYNLYPQKNNNNKNNPDDPDGSVKVMAEYKDILGKYDLSLNKNSSSGAMTNDSDNNL